MESDEMARISTARPMWSCINSLGAVWTQPLRCWEMTGHRIYLTVVQRSTPLLSALFASPLLRIPFLGTRDQAFEAINMEYAVSEKSGRLCAPRLLLQPMPGSCICGTPCRMIAPRSEMRLANTEPDHDRSFTNGGGCDPWAGGSPCHQARRVSSMFPRRHSVGGFRTGRRTGIRKLEAHRRDPS